MLSAGLLGGPGIGFEQDYYASESLKRKDPAVYERYKAPAPNEFLVFQTVGLDGAKVGVLEDNGKEAVRALEVLKKDPEGDAPRRSTNQQKLVDWWEGAKATAEADKNLVTERKPLRRPHGPEDHRRRAGHHGPDLPRHDPLLQDEGRLSRPGC